MAWLGSWAKRVQVTVDSTDVTSALSDFPVLIHLSSSCGKDSQDLTPVFDELGASDKKIAVTTDNGTTQLYVEVEEWDSVGEEAWLWTKVTAIGSASDTYFYLYYDVSQPDNNTYIGDPNSATAENVWDANFKLVCHMLDDPDNASTRDSTSNDNDGTKKGANTPIVTTSGMISDAQDFNGANTEYVSHGIGTGTLDIVNDLTISLWINAESFKLGDTQNTMLSKHYSQFELHIRDTGGGKTFRCYLGPAVSEYDSLSVINLATDYYVAITYDNANIRFYVQGVKVRTVPKIGNVTSRIETVFVGARNVGGVAFLEWNGIIDDVRISDTTVRSDAWLKVEYESGRDDLLSYGRVELIPVPPPGDFPPLRRRFSEDHLLQIQVRRSIIDTGIITMDMRRLVSESLVIDASVRRQVRERLVASGRVYTSRELHELVDDVITLLLLEQVDNIGG